jgi:Domain of unknown function (DUF927)
LRRLAPPILVTAFATSNPNTHRESAFTEIKFENRRGKWKKEIVSASLLTAQSDQLIKLLSERGYLWPPNKSTRTRVIAALSTVRPRRDIRVTSVPGWCGKSFVLPDESYRPSGRDRTKLLIAHHPTVRLGVTGGRARSTSGSGLSAVHAFIQPGPGLRWPQTLPHQTCGSWDSTALGSISAG